MTEAEALAFLCELQTRRRTSPSCSAANGLIGILLARGARSTNGGGRGGALSVGSLRPSAALMCVCASSSGRRTNIYYLGIRADARAPGPSPRCKCDIETLTKPTITSRFPYGPIHSGSIESAYRNIFRASVAPRVCRQLLTGLALRTPFHWTQPV